MDIDEQDSEEHETLLDEEVHDEDHISKGLLEEATVQDLVSDIIALMSEGEGIPEDEGEIPS